MFILHLTIGSSIRGSPTEIHYKCHSDDDMSVSEIGSPRAIINVESSKDLLNPFTLRTRHGTHHHG